jgi:amidophosphoribosyltransferase
LKYAGGQCRAVMDGLPGRSGFAEDKCGVAGVAAPEGVAPALYQMLRAVQHRGQESAGIATYDDGLQTIKGMGLVENVFQAKELERLGGEVGLGHTRYSTTGTSRLENAHPVCVSSAEGSIALGHNGDIVNSDQIRESLQEHGWAFITENDSEVVVRLFANQLSKTDDPIRAMREVMDEIVGAYSLVLLVGDKVLAVRDPRGIKPLALGKLPDTYAPAGAPPSEDGYGGGYVVASETVAIEALGGKVLRDVEPGEIVEITPDETVSHLGRGDEDPAHCMFEYVYFSRADSVLDGREVYDVRVRLGEQLADESPVDADVVVPVPDSGRSHALGFARGTGIPMAEGLMKNRYVHRTFIMPDEEARASGVRIKLNPVKSIVEDQRVVLVDDSIVRGTTMNELVEMVREAGAEEVHVRIGCPPITAPCYLGIDMSTREELIAASNEVDDIRDEVGADSLAYVSIDGLEEAIDKPDGSLCKGCLTGRYPVPVPGEVHRKQQTLF